MSNDRLGLRLDPVPAYLLRGGSRNVNFDPAIFYAPPPTVRDSSPSPIGETADGRYEALRHFLVLTLGDKF